MICNPRNIFFFIISVNGIKKQNRSGAYLFPPLFRTLAQRIRNSKSKSVSDGIDQPRAKSHSFAIVGVLFVQLFAKILIACTKRRDALHASPEIPIISIIPAQ